MKYEKQISMDRQKNTSGPIFVSRNIQNLYDYQLAIRKLLKKIFLPAQISGILPLQASEKIKVSYFMCLWTVLIQLSMTAVVYDVTKGFIKGVSVGNATHATKSGDGAVAYAEDAGKVITVVYIVLSTASILWHKELFDEIVKRFLLCQVLMSQIGLQYIFRLSWKPMVLHLPIVFACSMEIIGGNFTGTIPELFFKYSAEVLVGSMVVFFFQLISLCDNLQAYLNEQLLSMMSTNRSGKFRKICVMSDCQHYICSACQFANSLHSFPLVFLFLSIFIKTVVLIYKMVIVMDNLTAWKIAIFFSVLVAYISRSWCIVYICSRTAEQTRLFNKYLLEMIVFESGTETIHAKKLMLHLEMKREVEFHAKGFFVIDYPLLHSIAAAATSYLVIMVQTASKK